MSDAGLREQAGGAIRTLQIDVVSDAVCPWCYIGKRHLEAALAELPDVAATIHWRPYQLDPTIPPGGLDRRAYMARKFGEERLPDIHARLTEAGRAAGLDLAFDRIKRSPNTLDAHRLIRWAWSAGRQDAVVEALFRAFFIDGEDIGDREILAARAADAGMDREILSRLLIADADVDAVRDEIEKARSLGVTGVPFFILDGRLGVSGAQPPEVLARAIAKALEPAEQA